MPAYFSLIFTINKKKNISGAFKDFVELLEKNGFKYKSGFMEFESDTLSDVIKWNTRKLIENFELGGDMPSSCGYRQCYWEFESFSPVRLFVCNTCEDDYYTLHLIVPEDEVYEYTDNSARYVTEAVEAFKAVALAVWKRRYVMAVQASLEGSEDVAPEDIKAGKKPTVEPFAIVPAAYLKNVRLDGYLSFRVRRRGVLIEKN